MNHSQANPKTRKWAGLRTVMIQKSDMFSLSRSIAAKEEQKGSAYTEQRVLKN